MPIVTNTSTRPPSVMSQLADQMQSSCLSEKFFTENTASKPIDFISAANKTSLISSSAPTHRSSIAGACFSLLDPSSDCAMEQECQVANESDLSSPQLPPKRLCHSSTNDGIARPIPIKSHFRNIEETSNNFDYGNKHNRMSFPKAIITRNPCNFNIRPIISPHHKRSAFTPTRSLTSPQTTSSDYSISPDMESPIHRPASVTSSGFHDCSQLSLLIDPNYSPDSNQRSNCATIVNTKVPDNRSSMVFRCHSQPCDEPVSTNFNARSVIMGSEKSCTCRQQSAKYPSQLHTPMKRRYPSLSHIRSNSHCNGANLQKNDSPTYCHCNKLIPNSADTSPNACFSQFTAPKRDSYFFGSGRSYLISLPRIASSPPPAPLQSDPQNDTQNHRQRIASNSSSLSTSTTTDANTPTVIYGSTQQKLLSDSLTFNKENVDDVEMDDSLDENRSTMTFQSDCQCYDNFDFTADRSLPHVCSDRSYETGSTHPNFACTSASSCSASATSDMTTKSYSTGSDGASNGTNVSHSLHSESSRSEFRDPDDPPEIGFCFSQLNEPPDMVAYDENSSFQELDLDQIELD